MTPSLAHERIAVLGTGNVGRTLATGWVRAGATVLLAGRDAARTTAAAHGTGATPASPLEAVVDATLVVVAVPSSGLDEAMPVLATVRPGTVIVDATNGRVDGKPTPVSARAAIQTAAPQAVYVRAFNSTAWENMAEPELDGRPVDLFWCGPDDSDGERAAALGAALGMRPVRLGDASKTEALDALTALWFGLVFERGLGRRISFGVQGLPD